MKSFRNLTIILLMLVAFGTSCSDHSHVFSNDWEFDECYHWHYALCDHSEEREDYALHTFISGECSECGYIESSKISGNWAVTNDGSVYPINKSKVAGTVIVPPEIEGIPVISIREYAFRDCLYLNHIIIPSSIEDVRTNAFMGCSCAVEFAHGITMIPEHILSGCIGITSIVLPDTVTRIGYCAFDDCHVLSEIIIPSSVSIIDYYAFRGCECPVTFSEGMITIPNNALYGAEDVPSVILPSSTTTIGQFAFCECKGLNEITIPDSVTHIGGYAFKSCKKLSEINFGLSLQVIGEYAFYGCSMLTDISLPDEVLSIGAFSFSLCSAINSITIPDTVEIIGDSAFKDCINLININYIGTMADWDSVAKAPNWNSNVPASVVHCSDGDVAI